MNSPHFFADVVLAYNHQGEAAALRLLNDLMTDLVTCTKEDNGTTPKSLAAIKLAVWYELQRVERTQ